MCIVMLTLLEALDELNSKSESELTLDYLEELAKKVSIEPVPHLTIKGSEIPAIFGLRCEILHKKTDSAFLPLSHPQLPPSPYCSSGK